MNIPDGTDLISSQGRKYLTVSERSRFFECTKRATKPEVQTFAMTLVYTGCRISEALALRVRDIDLENHILRIKTLKRRKESWREVPVPEHFVRELQLTHSLKYRQLVNRNQNRRIWDFSRSTASRHIAKLMHDANIQGPQASSKGLRHAFGIAAVESGVPLPIIASVLGHAHITTTAIYTTAVGIEAKTFISRTWNFE